MLHIESNQILSTDGKYVHRTGTDDYFHRATLLPGEGYENFEEVDDMPPYTKSEYDAKVNELVRERYTEAEEFALHRKMLNAMLPSFISDAIIDTDKIQSEYQTYNEYVQGCKNRAKNISLYCHDQEM